MVIFGKNGAVAVVNSNRAYAEIDLRALASNVRALKRMIGDAKFMAVVKADAYGHGAVECARAARDAGADWLRLGVDQHLAHLPVDAQITEHVFPRIPIPHVVGRKLIVPGDLAGLRLNRKQRGHVKVVPLAAHVVPRTGVAGTPEHEVKFGVV